MDAPDETAKNETENQDNVKTSDYHTAPSKEKVVHVEPPVPISQLQPAPTLNPSASATSFLMPAETTQHVPSLTSIVAQPTPEEGEKWPPDSAGGGANSLLLGGPSFTAEIETIPDSLKPFLGNKEISHFGLHKDDNSPLRGSSNLPPTIPGFQRMNSGEKPFLHLSPADEDMPLPFPSSLETTIGKLEFSLDSGWASDHEYTPD